MRDVRSFRSVVLVAALLSCGRGDPTSSREPGAGGVERPIPSTGQGLLVSSPGSQVEEEYGYDDAGELSSIRTSGPPVALVLSDFDPKEGGAGRLVSITGAGFSPDPARNGIRLNGILAPVVASSATRLSFKVPAEASTGKITVSVGTVTATSAADFVVRPPVILSDFTPKVGKAGTVLTITGNNFDPVPGRNIVSVGGGTVTVTTASPTFLVVTLGSGAASGKVTVSTPDSSSTSSADFLLLPGALLEENVAHASRTELGAPAAVSIPTAGKTGVLLFEGFEGRYGSVHLSGVTYAGTTRITVFEPLGTSIFTDTIGAGQERKYAIPALPRTGTYLLVVQPAGTSSGTATVRVFEDAVVALDPRGGPATMSLARGQNGRFVFAGRPGDNLDLGITSLDVDPSGAVVAFAALQPGDRSLGSFGAASAPRRWQLPAIEMPGAHAVTVRPPASAGASVTVLLSAQVTGKFPAGALLRFQTERAGQTGLYHFDATAGESYTVTAVVPTASTTNVQVNLYGPGGRSVGGQTVSRGGSLKIDAGALAESGTYTVAVVPVGLTTAIVDLALLAHDAEVLVVDGPTLARTLAPGQNGRYTFAANAGDYVSVAWPALATSPVGGSVALGVLKPDGSSLLQRPADAPTSWLLPVIPATGPYTLTVSPSGVLGASVSALLSRPLTGSIAVGAESTRFESARPGQTGRYTFAASALESLTLSAAASTGFSGSVPITVYRPSGGTLLPSGSVAPMGFSKLDLSVLPETGVYTVVIVPPGVGTGSIDLSLMNQVTDTLVVGAAPKAVRLSSGQNGRFSFTAAAGDLLSLAYSSMATTPPGASVSLVSYRPDGSQHGNRSATQSGSWALPQLNVSGTYTIAVRPAGPVSLVTNLQLTRR